MWILGVYIAVFYGMPAAVILAAVAYFWRDSVRKNREARKSGELDERQMKKLKRRRLALTIAVVIVAVMVTAIFAVAVLFSTAISFM